MAAQILISKGKWVLIDDSEEQVSAGAPARALQGQTTGIVECHYYYRRVNI